MNICLFFEGTGQGVAGHITNVTRLRDLCAEDARQRLHLESGPGTRFGSYVGGRFAGVGWQGIFRSARRWFEANYESLPPDGVATFVFLFGFSRGALLARAAVVRHKFAIGGLWRSPRRGDPTKATLPRRPYRGDPTKATLPKRPSRRTSLRP